VGTPDFAVIADFAFWMVRLASVIESFVPDITSDLPSSTHNRRESDLLP
jgi:hypothetical protein